MHCVLAGQGLLLLVDVESAGRLLHLQVTRNKSWLGFVLFAGPSPGPEAKIAPGPDPKAGSPDPRANPKPSLTGAPAPTADPRRSQRSLAPDPGPGLGLPKKMVKEMLSLSPGQGVGPVPTLHSSSHLPRLAQSRHPKELRQGPAPDPVQNLAPDQDLVQEIKSRPLLLPCTLSQNIFLLVRPLVLC